MMSVEIINTGSELMLGKVLNTHAQWICTQLDTQGYAVARQVTVNDDGESICGAVREALNRSDIIIVTGGLGPTSDDLTRNLIADLLGLKLLVDEKTLQRIRNYFLRRNRPVPFHCEIQAQYPEGAIILDNDFGTAPGLLIETQGHKLLFMLPGPPRELHPMFSEKVIPLLKSKKPLEKPYSTCSLRTACVGESVIEEKIEPSLEQFKEKGLEIGYCARINEVDVRLSARTEDAAWIVEESEKIVREILAEAIIGEGNIALEKVVVNLLRKKNKTIALAESCTGGFIAHRITNVPGASDVMKGGCVTYTDEIKQLLLGVKAETLKAYTAVSQEVAGEMAVGIRTRLKTDYAVGVSGYAGPTGGTEKDPIGIVYVAIDSERGCQVERLFYPYDREGIKVAVSQYVLNSIRLECLKEP